MTARRPAARPAVVATGVVALAGLLLAALAALLLSPGLAPLGPEVAAAVPSGGPGADTPGTKASVSPRTLEPGQTLHFTVSGFPGGEVLNVKIDDGKFCSESGVHGACVVQQQRIPASGAVSGSLTVPGDLAPGAHWLRFLASEEVYDDAGAYQGIKGYTLRGNSDFTVVAHAAAGSSAPAAGAPASTGPPTTQAPTSAASTIDPSAETDGGADVAAPGATLTAPGSTPSTPAPTSAAPAPSTAPAPQVVVQGSPAEPESHLPAVGLAGLAVLVVASALVVLRRRRG
jgi:hypothetical protein